MYDAERLIFHSSSLITLHSFSNFQEQMDVYAESVCYGQDMQMINLSIVPYL